MAREQDPQRKKQLKNLRALTFFLNVNHQDLIDIDSVILMRAMIAAMVSVSLTAYKFYTVIALLLGFFSGGMFIAFLYAGQLMLIDDATYTTQVHGFSAMLALLLVCFFDKDEGFLFSNIYSDFQEQARDSYRIEDVDMSKVAPILLTLGANMIALFIVGFLVSFLGMLTLRGLMCTLTGVKTYQQKLYEPELADRALDIIGHDTLTLYCNRDRILINNLYSLVNEYYPSELIPAVRRHKERLLDHVGGAIGVSGSDVLKIEGAPQEQTQSKMTVNELRKLSEILESELERLRAM